MYLGKEKSFLHNKSYVCQYQKFYVFHNIKKSLKSFTFFFISIGIERSTQIKTESDALIARLAGLAPLSIASMLAIIKLVEEGRFDRVAAQALADACSQSEDLSEGLLAMREKRAPVFKRR